MKIQKISLKHILKGQIVNCRKSLEVDSLMQSIEATGIQTPLGVTEVKQENGATDYHLVYGFRRFEAATRLGLTEVPCVIIEAKEEGDLYILNLLENVARQDLNPMEEAEALQRIVDEGKNVEDFQKSLGWSKTRITQRLALNDMSEALKQAILSNGISVGQARAIAQADEGYHSTLITLACEGMTVKKLKAEVDQLKAISCEITDDSLDFDAIEEEEAPMPIPEEETLEDDQDDNENNVTYLDEDLEDKKVRAEADSNVIKSLLLDSGAKVLKEDRVYFGYQIAINSLDFSKLSQTQRDSLVTALNMLTGEQGIDAWGEAHRR